MKTLFFTLLTILIVGTSNAQTKNSMNNTKPYTILVLMNATSKWLSLSRDERSIFFESNITPIFKKVGKTTKVKLYDSEYFHSKTSDFMMITTTNLEDYKLLMELLRDSKIYGEPYFDIIDIIVGQENLFEDFNEKFKKEN
ncbi:darcynin family protein [Chryseobacterium lathyri]|jgi:hypothetical protein|uniref:DUF4174 domain-containing protein n=1 Tax=Chryseobacterium lathyri TaxID=395933 RepID=A0A511Y680_9FLAO|nr:darcynin family protein [Chryseobacterium lathyri]GEN70707.1 hypothetical protein CLA01_07790 [Chryseobacterium lathyri]